MSSCKRKTLRGSKFQWAMYGLPLSGAIICVLDRLKTSQRKGIVVSIPRNPNPIPNAARVPTIISISGSGRLACFTFTPHTSFRTR
jgi:hypothetical protein